MNNWCRVRFAFSYRRERRKKELAPRFKWLNFRYSVYRTHRYVLVFQCGRTISTLNLLHGIRYRDDTLRELKHYFCCSSGLLVYSDKRSKWKIQTSYAAMLKNREHTWNINSRSAERGRGSWEREMSCASLSKRCDSEYDRYDRYLRFRSRLIRCNYRKRNADPRWRSSSPRKPLAEKERERDREARESPYIVFPPNLTTFLARAREWPSR